MRGKINLAIFLNVNILSFLLFFMIGVAGCNSQANLTASNKEYTDEEWLQMIRTPENQVKTVWIGRDKGTIEIEGQWGMDLAGLSFLNTPSYIMENQIYELTHNRPLLFLSLFDENDPDIVLTGIYFYSRCNISRLNSLEQEQVKNVFKKALKHGDTRVRCAAIETLMSKHLLDIDNIKCGLDDDSTIVRDMTASLMNIIFKPSFYDSTMDIDDYFKIRMQKLIPIKRNIAPVLLDNLNDTSFYVRQMCSMYFLVEICPNINGESTGNHFDWVTSDWKNIIETQTQWKAWWTENGESVLLEDSPLLSSEQNKQETM